MERISFVSVLCWGGSANSVQSDRPACHRVGGLIPRSFRPLHVEVSSNDTPQVAGQRAVQVGGVGGVESGGVRHTHEKNRMEERSSASFSLKLKCSLKLIANLWNLENIRLPSCSRCHCLSIKRGRGESIMSPQQIPTEAARMVLIYNIKGLFIILNFKL